MKLEAIWTKDDKEVYKVVPVKNLLCGIDMEGIEDIEIYDGKVWHSYENFDGEADDFVIRIAIEGK